MLRLLMVTPEKEALSDFAAALVKLGNVDLCWAESGEAALNLASDTSIDLIITDESLGDMTGLEFASKLLSVNPMINCATVSRLPPAEFHQVSEGMGLLGQLPTKPDKEHAEKLMRHLQYIKNLESGMKI